MVRTKDKPNRLDSVNQKKSVSWNLNLNHSIEIPGSSSERDDAELLRDLIDDNEIDDDDDDIIVLTDEDSDDEYRPSTSFSKKAKPKKESLSSAKKPTPRKKETVIDYGLFKNVLQKCDFSVKIYINLSNVSNVYCLFGKISLNIEQFSAENLTEQEYLWLYVSKDINQSAIYFEWFEDSGMDLISGKPKKPKANNFKYFYISGCLNLELWSCLNTQCIFQVVFESFEDNKINLNVYLLKGALANVQYACEFKQGTKLLPHVLSQFYEIKSIENSGEMIFKHDIDSFYKAIRNVHQGVEYMNVDVQHPNLIPQLRPYQKDAVKWMLRQERTKGESNTKPRLHPLYLEITSLDNKVLYYNQYGRFFVSSKPLEVESSPGGILADEMGLGKTVEVLACIMCHHRENFSLTNSKPDLNSSTVRQNCPDIENSKDILGTSICNDTKVGNTENCKNDMLASEVNVNDFKNCTIPYGAENQESESEFQSLRPKRKSSYKINYSSLDSILDSDNESVNNSSDKDDYYKPEMNISGSDDEGSAVNMNQMINVADQRHSSRRGASQKRYFEDSENEAEILEPTRQKKRRSFRHNGSFTVNNKVQENIKSVSKKFDPEEMISQNLVMAIIDKVILANCWDGILGNYKKNGTFKGYRNFLKKRNTDPYYMMSLRERLNASYLSDLAEYSASSAMIRSTSICKEFFETKVKQKSYFECLCGKENHDYDEMPRVQCTVCSLWQHAECVQYDLNNPLKGNYICPHCWSSQPPVTSGATLIVAPSSISHQWLEEIQKHIKQKSLKVFVYNGVAHHSYIQPRHLAHYDIVITTYETLRRELNYVDLPHSNSEAGRRFRFPKRFMATPSPLPCVEWWRVCLDEAQMVECVTTKTAEMALRLTAINRWCITGTPIQKTVNDLQGLLMFLGVDPYCVPQWWQRCLYDPYCYGVTAHLHKAMAKYMWRNSKMDVIHQLDIPQQSEQMHWLSFTPVEEHFYKRLHSECSSEALRKIGKFSNRTMKLSSLDRKALSNLLQPLLKLRQACVHPQIVKGSFMNISRKTLTMEQLLENLIKKTQLEAEDSHRIIVASLNGLAAVDIIRGKFVDAVEKYREVLASVEEHKENFKTDSLQQLHTLHNLAEIMQAKHEGIPPTLRDQKLTEEAKIIREQYLKRYPQRIIEAETECNQNTQAVEEQQRKLKLKSDWWISAMGCFGEEFVREVREELLSLYTKYEQHMCILYPIQTRVQFMQLLRTKMKLLENQRKAMITNIREIRKLEPEQMLNGAIDCHLRPHDDGVAMCELCVKHELFVEFERNLFFMRDAKRNRFTDRSKETDNIINKLHMLDKTVEGNWGQGEIERVLRYIQTKSLGKVDADVYEESQTHLQVLQTMKKEFKNFRILWRAISDHVSALDEVSMATLRFRLKLPEEELPQVIKKTTELQKELEKKTVLPTYVLEQCELDQHELKLKSDMILSRNALRVRLGQLYYLKNLKKVDFDKDGNPDPCPICQGKLGEKWKVLMCGHSYCLECIDILVSRVPAFASNASSIKCPMCRQVTKAKEIIHVGIKDKQEKEETVKVIGSLSTKIEGVVRTMLRIKASDPEAKVLIFSSWNDVLEVIADGLAQNGITHRILQSKNKFQINLASFKASQVITALLLPLSSGANGLNLVEASHVILVEPILNPAAEVQAIGRVHRIGQTRTTVVHRFFIRSTIEERMHNILHPKYLQNASEDNAVSIEDLSQLFAQDQMDHSDQFEHRMDEQHTVGHQERDSSHGENDSHEVMDNE